MVSFYLLGQENNSKRILSVTSPRIYGKDVIYVQEQLMKMGFSEIGATDGYYGPKTEKAIKELQELVGLESTGIVTQKEYDFFESKISDLIIPAIYKYKNIKHPVIPKGEKYKMPGHRDGILFDISKDNKFSAYCFSIVDDYCSEEFLIIKINETSYFIVYEETYQQNENDSPYKFKKAHFYNENALYILQDGKLKEEKNINIEALIQCCEKKFRVNK